MKSKNQILKMVIIGTVTGFCNGIFGSGGGTIVVPAMIYFLGIKEHDAHATALAVILPLTIVSSMVYLKSGLFEWSIIWKVILGGIIGGSVGAWMLNRVPAYWLQKIFGFFMIVAAVRMIL